MKKAPPLGICPVSNKHRYDEIKVLEVALHRSRKTGGQPFRVYQCPDCDAWHMTSRVVPAERKGSA